VTRISSSRLLSGSPRARLPLILGRLERAYGRPTHARGGDPLDSLIATILSQHTSDVNSHRSFQQLRERFSGWQEVLRAQTRQIAAAIRPGGLAEVKSGHIKRLLREIERERGRPDLSFLRRLPTERARHYLLQLPGVGPKTAACVLLFALGRPAFPVDTHVLRVSQRLGLLPPRTTMERAHGIFAALLDSGGGAEGQPRWGHSEMLALHLGLVHHGREVCRSRRPRCASCTLFALCPRVGVEGAAIRLRRLG